MSSIVISFIPCLLPKPSMIPVFSQISYCKHIFVFNQNFYVSRETMYGRMWSFTSDFSRGDTAYTKLALDRHTDTSYFQEPSG